MSGPRGLGLDVQKVPKTCLQGILNAARLVHSARKGVAWETDRLLLSQTLRFFRATSNRNGNNGVVEVGIVVYEALSEARGVNCNSLSLLLQKGSVKAGWCILVSEGTSM